MTLARYAAPTFALLLATATPFRAAVAQAAQPAQPPQPPNRAPTTFSLRVDNDAFDFWMLPWNRPDDEYTSGVRLTYDGGDAPWWSRRLLGGIEPCVVGATACRTRRIEIGQDIYTGSTSVGHPEASPTARPSAAWLYTRETARELMADRADALSIALGVTGPPALGQQMQRLAHSVAPAFNRPADWSRQIGFEPGLIVRYAHERRVAADSAGPIGFDLLPRIAVDAGNVRDALEAGFRARVGWHLAHPWLPVAPGTEITLSGGITGYAVARDLFLDGNTFRAGPRVGHEPFTASGELALAVRHHWLSLSYRAVSDSRAYAAGPRWHPWSSLVASVAVDR